MSKRLVAFGLQAQGSANVGAVITYPSYFRAGMGAYRLYRCTEVRIAVGLR
jgi:hypothetical protein